ncbi:MAG TPA: hypothetical protein VF192_12975 [Longimicrobiales bacterium]
MSRTGKSMTMALAVVAGVWLALPAPATAQVGLGAHYARLADAFGGTQGAGARVTIGLPLFPVSAAINGEYVFPRCGDRDCTLRGVTADLNFSLPFPGLRTWVGVGWSVRQIDLDDIGRSRTERGVNLGAGAELGAAPLRPYLDVRYELADAPEEQLLLRLGLMLR